MASDFSHLRLAQIERALEPVAKLRGKVQAPSGGWLKAIREALGRSLRSQARMAGITAPTLLKSETLEARDRITLGQLRKLADHLDCELIYGLVPRQPLSLIVEAQAEKLAREEILGVAHTMSLEDQLPTDAFLRKQVVSRKRALLEGSWARLWR